MPAIYPYGGPATQRVDPLSGAGWTEYEATGGSSATWTSGTRLRMNVPQNAAGSIAYSSTSFVPRPESWDMAIRVQFISGSNSVHTRAVLTVGADSNNHCSLLVWGDGTIELGKVQGGGWTYIGWVSGPSLSDLTGGQLWIRLSSHGGTVRALWGIGSAGAIPASWSVAFVGSDGDYAKVSYGTWARIGALTLNSSVNEPLTTDVLRIISVSTDAAWLY